MLHFFFFKQCDQNKRKQDRKERKRLLFHIPAQGWKYFARSPPPSPSCISRSNTCFGPDVTIRGYSAGCRLTSRVELKKSLLVQGVQLSFAFLPNFNSHFHFYSPKLETTVSFVMSHVSPANFQALDQRVSTHFLIGKDCGGSVFWDKGTWLT